MAKRRPIDVGIDVEAAIKTLHREAIRAGAVPSEDPRARTPHDTAHAHLHGLESPTCTNSPCRVAGLCLALFELTQYQAEAAHFKPMLDAAELTHEVQRWIDSQGARYLELLDRLAKHGSECHELERGRDPRVKFHDHRLVCDRPFDIRTSLEQLRSSLEGFELGLRTLPQSDELRQLGRPKRKRLLRDAVWGHLNWGGFTYEEIFELVPGLGTTRDAKGIVAKALAERSVRSLAPREVHPGLPNPPAVPRARRRRRPT